MRRWIALAVFALIAIAIAIAAIAAIAAIWIGAPAAPRPERVQVSIDLPGADAATMDQEIGVPLASTFAALDPGVRTTSRDGRTDAILTGVSIEEVRRRLGALTERLPQEHEVVVIRAERGPVVRWIVRGDHAPARARRIRARISLLPGVSRVESCAREGEIEVLIDPDRLSAHALVATQIVDAIAASNREVAGGFLERGGEEILVRGEGRLGTQADLADVLVSQRDGIPVRVRDVARVSRSFARVGCRCVGADECATGVVFLRDDASIDRIDPILREEGAVRAGRRALVVVAGPEDELLDDLASRLARAENADVEIAPIDDPDARPAHLAVWFRGDDVEIDAPGLRVLGEDPMVIDVIGDDAPRARAPVEAALRRAGFTAATYRSTRRAIRLDRERLSARGLAFDHVRRTLTLAAEGELVGWTDEGGERTAIRARLDQGPEDVLLTGPRGSLPLQHVSTIEEVDDRVYRCGTRPCIRIYADGQDVDRARDAVARIHVPRGVTIEQRDDH